MPGREKGEKRDPDRKGTRRRAVCRDTPLGPPTGGFGLPPGFVKVFARGRRQQAAAGGSREKLSRAAAGGSRARLGAQGAAPGLQGAAAGKTFAQQQRQQGAGIQGAAAASVGGSSAQQGAGLA